MNTSLFTRPSRHEDRGFALVVAVSMMVLLLLLAVGMLSLSTLSTRQASVDNAMERAQANARMAPMLAIGELQVEMGPDMRVSAEAAIHDADPSTETIEGVAQPHWTAVYDSWGNYLNADFTPEGKPRMTIGNTYGTKRAPMFRRWLVSLPEDLQGDVNAATAPLSDEESVIMVGEGTLGRDYALARPEKVTRAYRIQTDDRGAYAWWVSPENHKAKINLAAQDRGELSADEWAVSQGVASEVAIGGIDGLGSLDISNPGANEMADRIVSLKTLQLPAVGTDKDKAKAMFFDLTEVSSGILSNTRSGGLKKDLSLLFENSDTTIAPEYTQADRFAPEPSIRPHSRDILAKDAVLPRRPFASWPRMRHYYRMYRQDVDSAIPSSGLPTHHPERNLRDSAGAPVSGLHAPYNMRASDKDTRWFGENSYLRFPVLLRFLTIHSYQTERYYESRTESEEVAFHFYDIPVVTLWNPYSTQLTIPGANFGVQVSSPRAWPRRLRMYDADGTARGEVVSATHHGPVPIRSEDGSDIVFQPGEVKTFSFKPGVFLKRREGEFSNPNYGMFEGFDPTGTGGITDGGPLYWKRVSDRGVFFDRTLEVAFTRAPGIAHAPANCNEGNSPGSLTMRIGFGGDWKDDGIPPHYQIDWFQNDQLYQTITGNAPGERVPLVESEDPLPIGYSMVTLKTTNRLDIPASWAKDWRSRNWLHAPPYGFGGGLYMTEHSETRAHTQRLDSAYEVSFGPTSPTELIKLAGEVDGKPWLGFGPNPFEKVTAVSAIELPTAPISSLASFSGMRISPGWIWSKDLNPDWVVRQRVHEDISTRPAAFYNAYAKHYAYQSGITGGGIGNSFVHPMIPRDDVYFYHDNSVSQQHVRMDLLRRNEAWAQPGLVPMEGFDTKAYCDYWDHVLLLNDSLWDEYFISSIADQTRPWASESDNLDANIDSLTAGEGLPISRYKFHSAGLEDSEVQDKLKQDDAYLRAAEHLLVDGAFNVNSTSVKAWYALFKGIRERKLFYRDSSGNLREVDVPAGHIALSRLDTPTIGEETTDLTDGVVRDDDHRVWSGVRFISDEQIRLLAEKCVEQVKRRGPFLNFSEFINRRLENSELGLMGALQSAIDFDDAAPSPGSINYRYKSTSHLQINPSDLGSHEYSTPEAVEGSRLAGIPGYVMQSDLLKPIANTLQVRDDTFRIRAYGEALDSEGNVIARAWCEAIVQRNPEYVDPSNDNYEPAYTYLGRPRAGYDPRWGGMFRPNRNLSPTNKRFGRKFEMKSFRWLASDEV